MDYTPIRYIVKDKYTLSEKSDLSVPLSQLVGKDAYLVVQDTHRNKYTLSISQMITFIPNLNKALHLDTVFNSILTDINVERYNDSTIPVAKNSGYYQNRLRVLNPISYKEYAVHFTSVNRPEIIDETINKGTLDDIVIKSDENLSQSLVAVNGVFHKTSLLGNDLYVLDGFRTMRLTGRNDMTLVDTSKIGGHSIIDLNPSNVSLSGYNGRAVITLPSSILNKTICIVVDGYFYHLESEVLSIIDDTHVSVDLTKLLLIKQFRHNPRTVYKPDRFGESVSQYSSKYRDPFDVVFLNKNQVPMSTFTSLDFQLSRLRAYHSFLVVFNRPNIFSIRREVVPTDTQRFYYDYTKLPLSGMLSFNCGLCPSYLIHQETKHRRQIFISDQDEIVDYFDQTINPEYIAVNTKNSDDTRNISCYFIDYIST